MTHPTIGLGLVAKSADLAAARAASMSACVGAGSVGHARAGSRGAESVPSGRSIRRASRSARSWPHAASASPPRVSRTVTRAPRSAPRKRRATDGSGGPQGLPSIRFMGMTLMCAWARRARSRSPSACSIESLTPPIRHHSKLIRRPLCSAYRDAASSTIPSGIRPVDGHQPVTQLVCGRVQRNGECHRHATSGELLDARHHPARRDSDPPGTDPRVSDEHAQAIRGWRRRWPAAPPCPCTRCGSPARGRAGAARLQQRGPDPRSPPPCSCAAVPCARWRRTGSRRHTPPGC